MDDYKAIDTLSDYANVVIVEEDEATKSSELYEQIYKLNSWSKNIDDVVISNPKSGIL